MVFLYQAIISRDPPVELIEASIEHFVNLGFIGITFVIFFIIASYYFQICTQVVLDVDLQSDNFQEENLLILEYVILPRISITLIEHVHVNP